MALHSHGLLAAYFTGLTAAQTGMGRKVLDQLACVSPSLRNRIIDGLPPAKLRALFWAEGAARAASGVASILGLSKPSLYDALFVVHDRAVASLNWPSEVRATYAYEDGALRTFERARRHDLARVYDLPSPHYATVERMWREEARRWPDAVERIPEEAGWKKRRKDQELALASVICVASAFSRQSLDGLATAPVATVPYGFPVSEFTPIPKRLAGPFTVLAVGTQSIRKGTHYLLEAWRQAGLRDARLRLVGRMSLPAAFLTTYTGLYEHLPPVPRAQLQDEYRGADILAFPTLCDGFGLVIQEAMCCGTPVVTTPCGGGPECLRDGVEGWIVPRSNVDALVEVLRTAAGDRDRTKRMGLAARRRAEGYTWDAAMSALLEALAEPKREFSR
jgi:glycosyltransferase involved in cell wall biosynthesis